MKHLIKRDWHAKLARDALRSFVTGQVGQPTPSADGAIGTSGGGVPDAAAFTALKDGDMMDMYHATSLLRSKKEGLTEDEASIVETFLLDGIWTLTRLYEAGYDVQDKRCPLCLGEEDTIEHRLFRCPHGDLEDHRRRLLPSRIRQWIVGRKNARKDPDNRHREEAARCLARRGLARNPALHQPPPAEDGADFKGDADLAFSSGTGFTDGGCTKPFHPSLARASWAAGSVDEEGNLIGVATGPVWRNLPQTSPSAEVVGMAAAAQLTPPATASLDLHIDNMMVVQAINQPLAMGHLHRAFHAGVLRTARSRQGWKAIQGNCHHIKAHQFDDRPDDIALLPAEDRL